jgi:hypothetical protein
MSARLPYFADCTSLPMPDHEAIEALNEFDDGARYITFETFARRTDWQQWAREHGYTTGPSGPKLLHLKDDRCVTFRVGRFRGRRAYCCDWSAIHVLFVAHHR